MRVLRILLVMVLLGSFATLVLDIKTSAANEPLWVNGQSPTVTDLGFLPESQHKRLVGNLDCTWREIKRASLKKSSRDSNNNLVYSPNDIVFGSPEMVCGTQNNAGFFSPNTSGSVWTDNLSLNLGGSLSSETVIAVPGSRAVITRQHSGGTGVFGGSYLRLDLNFGSYMGKIDIVSGGLGFVIDGNKLNEGWRFVDTNKPIEFANFALSRNGHFMVAALPTTGAIVRIDLRTLVMTPFGATSGTYGFGQNPGYNLSISNDGNFVASHVSNGKELTIYELKNCEKSFIAGQWPSTRNSYTFDGCTNKVLYSQLKQIFPQIDNISTLRFSPNNEQITGFVNWRPPGGISTWHEFRIQAYGTEPTVARGYLAMGDSFASGEGDNDSSKYEFGTDTHGSPENLCHLSKRSYPYLTAASLGLLESGQTPSPDGLFHSVACSGALSHHMAGGNGLDESLTKEPRDNQFNFLPSASLGFYSPGYTDQIGYIEGDTQLGRKALKPEAITLSIGGNDFGVSQHLMPCVLPSNGEGFTCNAAEDINGANIVAQEIANIKKNVVDAVQSVKNTAPEARIYLLGYPQLFEKSGDFCAGNVRLDSKERVYADAAIHYMNQVIKSAAKEVGVFYVDVENILQGLNLCSPIEDRFKAVNGVTIGDDKVTIPALNSRGFVSTSKLFGNESFHPNELAHPLYRDRLLAATNNLTAPMPTPQQNHVPKPDYYFTSQPYDPTVSGVLTTVPIKRFFIDENDPVFKVLKINLDNLRPNTKVEVWGHSTPVLLGTFTSDANGKIETSVSIPESMGVGYHEVHVKAKNYIGLESDYYEPIIVASNNPDDVDGDLVLDLADPCLFVEATNEDVDDDGVDDGCDADLATPPADSTPPVVTGTPNRSPDMGDWYNHDVTINWAASDPEPSSGAPTQPDPAVANQDGTNIYASTESCDPIGNCATGSLEIRLDKTAPQVGFSFSQASNASGWNNGDVTVIFDCSDTTSGVASCSEQQTVTGEGVFIITGTATDNAGNTAEVNVVVMIDRSPPTVTNHLNSEPNSVGWYNTDVTIAPECGDQLSGVLSCTPAMTLMNEDVHNFNSTAVDNASNSATAQTQLKIDKTAPTLGTPSWSNNPKAASSNATLTIPQSDNLSGITEAEYFLGDVDPGQGNGATMFVNNENVSTSFGIDFPTGVWKVSVRAKDAAGNWSATVSDYLVVYSSDGVRMTGKRTLLPSLANGDILPGLISAGQDDRAKFGFNVRYDKNGQIHPHSDFQFEYETGTKCNKPAKAQNCHSLKLNATSIAWLTTQGTNDSTGIFQGVATVVVDGTTSQVVFRLTGVDGEKLDAISPDHLTLKIFAQYDDPNTANPIYKVGAEVLSGNIRIRNR